MRFLRYNLLVAAMLMVANLSAKDVMTPMYVFGFAASFNDSKVYFTDIQKLDSAYIDTKTNFLVSRENYSYQLRDYLADQGEPNRTCIVVFAPSQQAAEKKFNKLNAKYITAQKKKKHVLSFLKSKKAKRAEANEELAYEDDETENGQKYDIKYLTNSDFTFRAIAPYSVLEAEANAEEAANATK